MSSWFSMWWPVFLAVGTWTVVFVSVVTTMSRRRERRRQELIRSRSPVTDLDQWKRAEKTAHKRLMAALNAKQREQYDEFGYFDVVADSGNIYRLNSGGHIGNIFQLSPESAVIYRSWQPVSGMYSRQFCMHLSGYCDQFPEDDHLLAQALLIRTDEVAFLRIACSLH